MSSVRVRFAPSPTGALHIGGARTALFNWLFARGQKGSFILRLEDTDTSRSTDDSALGILDGLKWLGIDWDEGPDVGGPFGPYRQSERLPVYQQYIQQLLQNRHAYHCFCSLEEISQKKNEAAENKLNYRHCCPYKDMAAEEIQKRLEQGLQSVVRLKVPLSGTTVVDDLVRGQVSFDNSLLDDLIIQKSDGWPTYNFAVVVDDHLMEISHVIRAEEHLSNTPKQIHIYEALGFNTPHFAHVSMILAPDRSKLSKRHGATSVQEFRELGYLPQALMNYLALLGWSAGDDSTLFALSEIIERFRLEDVSRSPAIYDLEKLSWMNGYYISQSSPEQLMDLLTSSYEYKEWFSSQYPRSYGLEVIKLLQPRIKTLQDFLTAAHYFFNPVQKYDEKGVQKYWQRDNSRLILEQVLSLINAVPFNTDALEQAFRQRAEELGLKAGDLIHPARLAVTGRTSSPGIFEVLVLLGQTECRERLENSIRFVETLADH